MNLYLMQHGEAVPEEMDASRPLSEEGRHQVTLVAARCGLRLSQVLHSDKLRARQSAEILAQACGSRTVERPDLGPNAAVEPVLAWLSDQTEDLALVGHLPFLSRLAGRLLVGDADRPLLAFRNAGLLKMARQPQGWQMHWHVWPEML